MQAYSDPKMDIPNNTPRIAAVILTIIIMTPSVCVRYLRVNKNPKITPHARNAIKIKKVLVQHIYNP